MKLWLCGQVGGSGEINNLESLLKVKDYFDGLCWCVNYNTEDFSDDDGTFEFLTENKKEGKIIRANWVNINSLGMTMALQCGKIKEGDWVVFLDSQEELKVQFASELRANIEELEKRGVESLWWGRPYIFKFHEDMTFQPTSVHCMVSPLRGQAISIQDESKVKYDEGGVHFGDFIYNKKKLENSMLLHGVKYCLFNVTNQMSMFYQGKELEEHESSRIWFNRFLTKNGYERTLNGLEKFLREENMNELVKSYLNFEFVFRDFYRYKILNHPIDEIIKTRFEYQLL
jgi:hypothetical protein